MGTFISHCDVIGAGHDFKLLSINSLEHRIVSWNESDSQIRLKMIQRMRGDLPYRILCRTTFVNALWRMSRRGIPVTMRKHRQWRDSVPEGLSPRGHRRDRGRRPRRSRYWRYHNIGTMSWLGKASLRQGFADLYRSGAPEEIITIDIVANCGLETNENDALERRKYWRSAVM